VTSNAINGDTGGTPKVSSARFKVYDTGEVFVSKALTGL
jgi:hypothetical protein